MTLPFDALPDDARVWIYQASRSFNDQELQEIGGEVDAFLQQWTAHGRDLQAAYDLPYNRFIVIGLDQADGGATGCSIDASVHFIQSLERKYEVTLMDKMNVSFKNGQFVAYKDLAAFRKMAKDKSVTKNTIVFNNLVQTVGEYKTDWEVPASESWHARFFK